MEIIVKKVNKSEKLDFPKSVISLQFEKHYTILTQDNIEKIIDKLIVFSKQQQIKKQKIMQENHIENRILKFKAWDNKLNKMSKLFPLELKDFGKLGFTLTSNDFTFIQYTGLRDKNGKEIYESDIIKLHFETKFQFVNVIGIVKYKNYGFITENIKVNCYWKNKNDKTHWKNTNDLNDSYRFDNLLAHNEIEIIGNILS